MASIPIGGGINDRVVLVHEKMILCQLQAQRQAQNSQALHDVVSIQI